MWSLGAFAQRQGHAWGAPSLGPFGVASSGAGAGRFPMKTSLRVQVPKTKNAKVSRTKNPSGYSVEDPIPLCLASWTFWDGQEHKRHPHANGLLIHQG